MTTDDRDVTAYRFFRQIASLAFVDRVVLFGSRARGDHHDRSDIDLAVFCVGASTDNWREVKNCLREGRIDTLLDVDCVRFDDAPPALKERILEEGKVLYRNAHPEPFD
jgi:predicted nucleotidyltransferase